MKDKRHSPLLLLILLELFGLTCSNCNAASGQQPLETYKIYRNGRLIYLPVNIGVNTDQEFPFFLTTGSNPHGIDKQLVRLATTICKGEEIAQDQRRFLLPIYNEGKEPTHGIVARLGKLPLGGKEPVHVTDLSRFWPFTAKRFLGALGAPFLENRTVEIDFDRGRLAIWRPADFDPTGWNSLPLLEGVDGRPYISNVHVGKRSDLFQISTGYDLPLVLHQWLFSTLVSTGDIEVVGSGTSLTAEGKKRSRKGWLRKLALGPFQHGRILVGEGRENIIGLGYWRRYAVALDMTNHRIYLRKGRFFGSCEIWNRSGIGLRHQENTLVVDASTRGRVAWKQGVRAGDRVVQINGIPATRLAVDQAMRLLGGEQGDEVHLVLERKGQTIRLTLPTQVDHESGKPIETEKPSKAASKSGQPAASHR